jgi:hypothetical protein
MISNICRYNGYLINIRKIILTVEYDICSGTIFLTIDLYLQ